MNSTPKPQTQHAPPFGLETSIEVAKTFMATHGLSHYAVAEHNKYLGNIFLDDVMELDPEESLETLRHDLEIFFADEKADSFDILELCAKNNANAIPVLDSEKKYLGYYRFTDLIDFFSETPFFSEKATTLTIEKNSQKYSFAEITHLVESNHSNLLGVFISKIENNHTQIILKIHSENINEVIQSFRRHDYEILSKHVEDQYTNELQERSNYLNKYLNI